MTNTELFEMAKTYYDKHLWNNLRIAALVKVNKLTADQYKETVGTTYVRS